MSLEVWLGEWTTVKIAEVVLGGVSSQLLVESEEFKWSDIEDILRKNFPQSTNNLTLNLAQILSGLAHRTNSIIKRSPKGDAYCFSDPKYRMCLRAMLRKRNDSYLVEKLPISEI